MRIALIIVGAVVLTVLGWMSVFTVDPTVYVYLTQFGRHVETYDGSLTDTDAGLHFRWPWPVQTTRRLDRRLQFFDLPAIELLTRDVAGGGDKAGGSSVDKTLTVEAYICWRIADKDHVDTFVRRIDTAGRAREILGQRVNSELGALIGQMRMDDLISTDILQLDLKAEPNAPATMTKVDWNMDELRKKLLASVQVQVRDEYGIEIVDIRLRRFNHPAKVRETIFSRIISERELKAAKYKNEGKQRGDEIRSVAEAEVDLLSRAAEKVEKEAKREAEAEAALLVAIAAKKDQAFFRFWHEMEQMKAILGSSKTTLLLSTHRSVFDSLFNVPGVDGRPAIPRPNPGDLPPKKED